MKTFNQNEEQRLRGLWCETAVDDGPSADVLARIRQQAQEACLRGEHRARSAVVRPLLRVWGKRPLYAAAAALLLLGGAIRVYRSDSSVPGQRIEELNAAFVEQLALVDESVMVALSLLEDHAVSDEILLDALAMHISIWEDAW